ncbi:MAG: ABC-type Fe3+-hydroxamate transport system,periplasmic component [Chthonomonadales bacterium]|nr:ABC-type Fe3+-hydroxamate transport system,periplasmic component [Chthonomonadales bacterium]
MKVRNFFGFLFILGMAGLVYWRLQSEPKPIKRTAHPRSTQSATEAELAALPMTFPLALTDSAGRLVSLRTAPQRIVSLAPSCTELLYDLGLGNRIVANSSVDDYPAEATKKPHIGGYTDMSVERVLAQKPDLIVADNATNRQIITQLETTNVPMLVLEAHTVMQVYDTIRILGRATGQNSEAERSVARMKARLDTVRKAVSTAIGRPRVVIIYGVDPIYTTGPGSFLDDLVTIAGGKNIVLQPESQITSEEVIQAQPDVILCDTSIKESVAAISGWKEHVPAVMHSTYFMPSENATIVRGVPRLAQAAEELAHFLHPELFTADGQPASVSGAPAKP